MSRRLARRFAAAACAAAAMGLGACATGATRPAALALPEAPDPRIAAALPSDDPRVGLETRQWLVNAPPARIAAAIAAWSEDRGDSAERGEGLGRVDGLVLARGRASALPQLLEALGGSRTDLRVWHGQATDWRDLAGVNLARSAIAMVAGRPQPIPPGRLALQIRGWAQPMEDGAACEVELGLRWKPERRASITLADRPGADLQWVGTLASRIELRRDEVLVVTNEPPPETREKGPPVAIPPSLGRLILPEPAHGLATVLVVWPNLPARLFPDAADPETSSAPGT